MDASHPIYGALIRLYPSDFRAHYGDDLLQHFDEMRSDRGALKAWTRTGVDLIVTLPRYRLETLMSEQHTATTLNIVITLLSAAGVASVLTGLYPGAALLLAAAVLAVAQRSTLATAIRTPDSNRRRRRLTIAAALAVVCVGSIISFARATGGDDISGTSLVLHNAIGIPTMVGAIVFFVAGLLTPSGTQTAAPLV